jgi:hypothetical protein
MRPNVEVTGVARVYRAASGGPQGWTKPLRGGSGGDALASEYDLTPRTRDSPLTKLEVMLR